MGHPSVPVRPGQPVEKFNFRTFDWRFLHCQVEFLNIYFLSSFDSRKKCSPIWKKMLVKVRKFPSWYPRHLRRKYFTEYPQLFIYDQDWCASDSYGNAITQYILYFLLKIKSALYSKLINKYFRFLSPQKHGKTL